MIRYDDKTSMSRERSMKMWIEFTVEDATVTEWVERAVASEQNVSGFGGQFVEHENGSESSVYVPYVRRTVHTPESAKAALGVYDGQVGETDTSLRREALDQAIRYAADFSEAAGLYVTRPELIATAEEFHTFLTGDSGNESTETMEEFRTFRTCETGNESTDV